jgi:hypothetical protein
VNAADASDILDEEAERQAFMAAVAEWRRADEAASSSSSTGAGEGAGGGEGEGAARRPLKIVREYLPASDPRSGKTQTPSLPAAPPAKQPSSSSSSASADSMWVNPFAPAAPYDANAAATSSQKVMTNSCSCVL